jgi:Rrf2 family protein
VVLKISQKLEYAMRAMIELALRREDGGLVPAREIALAQQVPLRFLEQQLGALHKAGLVESFRGAGGGCRIAKDPAEIKVADIADAIEGQLFPMFCLEPSDHTCFQDSRCGPRDRCSPPTSCSADCPRPEPGVDGVPPESSPR